MTDADDRQLIAILEDEPEIRRIMMDVLEGAGFRTMGFSRATEFEAALRHITPDACLVDLGLPDRDGLALVHRLAMESGAAIIIVSGRAQVQDRVTGLELGADDYIIKPFEPAELLARLRARLRRPAAKAHPDQRSRARFAGWIADFDRYSLTSPEGSDTPMSHAEAEVLRIFLDASRRLISRAQMQESLGAAGGESFDRAMDVRISRLRSKLGEDPKNPQLIKTIYGAGYIFLAEVSWN
ncbi:MAG TPA: response regulator transcription factor [Paracoccus sp. (in: a-proteobacteria)]|uniref:response regulator transcription factor n=1 Tax=uncultured Paracoccus sp. TaxID=189685 RepID=UPI001DF088A4|nr:response regulator transcription factor [uncultured Paracoccus sp.]MCB1408557.1 response regulator transcription factor [Paracoccaceae bacterium]HMQ42414.1 response regulator transcription factor [Paracoccus sp. (in: a-proteobacteria)]HMR37350.1 response regulator transcription factor [Paracoccus sp. (in: a-proteobacteria)]